LEHQAITFHKAGTQAHLYQWLVLGNMVYHISNFMGTFLGTQLCTSGGSYMDLQGIVFGFMGG